jgi:hypothetical protein
LKSRIGNDSAFLFPPLEGDRGGGFNNHSISYLKIYNCFNACIDLDEIPRIKVEELRKKRCRLLFYL